MLLPFTFNSQSSNGSGVIRLYENLHSAALATNSWERHPLVLGLLAKQRLL